MTECTSQDAAMRAEFEAWAAEEWAGRSVPDNAWLGWKGAMAAMQQRLAENAEIVAVYDKLHKHNVVGGHWMWGMVAQAAESGDAEQALRDRGFVPATAIEAETKRCERLCDDILWMVERGAGESERGGRLMQVMDNIRIGKVPSNWRERYPASEVNDGAASLNSGAAKDEQ